MKPPVLLQKERSRHVALSLLWLGIGAFLFVFVDWKWNIALAAWLSPIFLLKYFRGQRGWPAALVSYPVLAVASFAKFSGTWGAMIGPGAEAAVSAVLPIPFVVALAVDRLMIRRLPGAAKAFVFPAAYVGIDFAFAHVPNFGAAGSISASQFGVVPILQILSVTGIWGVSFLMLWLTSAVVTWWEGGFPTGRSALPPILAVSVTCLALVAGGFWSEAFDRETRTVKIAGIVEEQQKDSWGLVFDQAVPRSGAEAYRQDFAGLESRLMQRSEAAAQAGARVIFWSEANLFVYEDEMSAFLERAEQFARNHRVYFAPSFQVLHFGSSINDNRSTMITPEGEIAYTYRKTMSYYPTGSDGVVRFVDTPYGRIGSAICFDMDFPFYARQAGEHAVDIMLVPAFDTKGGSPFHSYVGLLRAVENGCSIFRSTGNGVSMAVDYRGQVMARQDFFASGSNAMYADLPVHGIRTPYSRFGDWLVYASLLFIVGGVLQSRIRSLRPRGKK
jgi:apolipoprotein N-acyltransferase